MYANPDYAQIAQIMENKALRQNLKPLFVNPNNPNSRAIPGKPFALLRFHNYRRCITLIRGSNSGVIARLKKAKNAHYNPHTKVVTVPDFLNTKITLQLGKEKLTGIHVQKKIQSSKETYRIEGNREIITAFVHIMEQDIKNKLDNFLKHVCEDYKILYHHDSFAWSQRDFWLRLSSVRD